MRCTDIELNFEWRNIPHTYVLGAESTILYGYGAHPSQPPQRELHSNGTAYAVFTSPVECLAAARELTCPQPLSTFVVHEDMSAIRLEGLMSDFWYREKPFDETYGPYWDKNHVNAAVYQASRNLSQTDGTCLLFAMTFLTNLVANMRYYDFMLYKGEPHDEHCFEHITSLARGIAATSHGFLYTEFSCAFSAKRTLQLIDQGYAIQVKLYTGVSFPVTTDTYEVLPVPHSAVFLRTNTSTYAVIDQNGARVIRSEKLNELLYDNMRHSSKNTYLLFGVRGDSSMFKYNVVAKAIMCAQSETLIRLPHGNETDMSNINAISKLPGTTSATFDVTKKSCYGEIAMFILTNESAFAQRDDVFAHVIPQNEKRNVDIVVEDKEDSAQYNYATGTEKDISYIRTSNSLFPSQNNEYNTSSDKNIEFLP